MTKHFVCKTHELRSGQLREQRVGGVTIAIGRNGREFYALRNRCPHQGAPLAGGSLSGTIVASAVGEFRYGRDGEILRCPWHGWEFDAKTGCSLHDPEATRVGVYDTLIEGDDVYVVLGRE